MSRWVSEHRALCLLPAALCLLLALVGCGSLFDTEYYVSGPYQPLPPQEAEDSAPGGSITSYEALYQTLQELVSDRAETAQLSFAGYEGDLSQDLAAACFQVKSDTALGAFAVENISYDLSRIVSYYQADVHLSYKRTAAQVAALEQIPSGAALQERLALALREDETYLVLQTGDADLTAADISRYVTDAFLADPIAIPVLPQAEAALFPETGEDRIAEIHLTYGLSQPELEQRRQELAGAIDAIESTLDLTGPAEDDEAQAAALRKLCAYLALRCRTEDGAGDTAWDALVGGQADSQGMALALTAFCRRLGPDCQVVAGRLEDAPHCWNIVTLADGASYHVDLAGRTRDIFLAGDDALWGAYWWDTSQYPACPAGFDQPEQALPWVTPAPQSL